MGFANFKGNLFWKTQELLLSVCFEDSMLWLDEADQVLVRTVTLPTIKSYTKQFPAQHYPVDSMIDTYADTAT